IIEYLAEKFPGIEIWPRDVFSRAQARSIAHEMHGGFLALRKELPMNLGKRFKTPALSDDAKTNVARIEQLWRETRAEFAGGNDFLLGNFCAADAMFAPVVTRLDTYQVPVAADTRAYMDAVLTFPAFAAWKSAALAEPWTIEEYEDGHEAVETYR
ncbi:MAG: glutathione S-transferase, partial [Hyphomicrobiaceae bacterium]|nr:glutathione S-transferase [Hyphomicrobiaceae bacterium]